QRDAVGGEREVDPPRGDPRVRLTQLEPVATGRERHPGGDGQRERGQRPAQRHPLGQPRPAAGQQPHHDRADQRRHRQDRPVREPGPTNHPACTAMTAATMSTTPTSIDSAYDRTKPVCNRRSRPDPPPTAAASPLTTPATPRLSTYTSARVSHRPGFSNSASLIASP